MIKTPKPPAIPAAYIKERAAPRPSPDKLAAMVAEFKPPLIAAFAAVNGRASAFTLDASDAIAAAREAEQRLAADGVTVANRTGASVTVRSAGPSAKAYKYAAKGTAFTLRRTAKGDWQLVAVAALDVHPKQPGRTRYAVSAAAAEDITRRALADYDSP